MNGKLYKQCPILLPLIAQFVGLSMTTSVSNSKTKSLYDVKAGKLGVEVVGVNLNADVPSEVIEQIRRDVHRYRIMIFRNQGSISGRRHIEISRWFGELDSTFYRHPRSPDVDVFRVSNDRTEGCTGVGRTGWHIDGSFQPAPFAYALYYMAHVPSKGDTVFAPLNELIMALSPSQRDRWQRLWMVSDARADRIHPLVHPHPVTGKLTLCFHLGMTEAFVWDYKTEKEHWTSASETSEILEEIRHEFVKDDGAIQYSHKWVEGDFIISDNLAVGHEATTDTQLPREEVGLRVLHRTTVRGKVPPSKTYDYTLPIELYHDEL